MSDKVDTGGKRLNLFPAKKQKKKLSVDDKAFNMMEAVADKTNVDIFAEGKKSSTKGIHTALLAAGMTPAYGNVADVADATLYALEGEFGEAAWSMAAAIPIVGQMVAGRRAAKVAKEAGEEMVTVYRGVRKVDDVETMVKKGKVVGKFTERFKGKSSIGADIAEKEGRKLVDSVVGPLGPIVSSVPKNVNVDDLLFTTWSKKTAGLYKDKLGMVLEFEVPVSWVNKHGRNTFGRSLSRTGQGWGTKSFKKSANVSYPSLLFTEGLPIGFLKKVHK